MTYETLRRNLGAATPAGERRLKDVLLHVDGSETTVVTAAYRLASDDAPLRMQVIVDICRAAASAYHREQVLLVDVAKESGQLIWRSDLPAAVCRSKDVLRIVPLWP